MPATAKSHAMRFPLAVTAVCNRSLPFKRHDLILGADFDAVRAVDRRDRCADLGAEYPSSGTFRKDRGHPNPELRQRGRDLATDETHAYDHRAPIRNGLPLDRVALRDGPEVVDPGQLAPGTSSWRLRPPVAISSF